MSNQAGSQKFVGAVEHAVRILRHLANAGTAEGVAAIARETGLNVSTTFNILRTLCKEGLAVFDTKSKSYRLGLGVLEFSAAILGTNQADLIRPDLERLSDEHSVLIGLWLITRNERIVLIDRVVARKIVRADMELGSRLPAYVGAVGRCVAAASHFSRAELKKRFDKLRWQSAPDFETYAAEVEAARTDGYASDFGQLFQGLDIVASIIQDHEGKTRFGISGITITGQIGHDAMMTLAADIRDTAAHVSAKLFGYAGQHNRATIDKPPVRSARRHGGSAIMEKTSE